jgi:hypothetical protein
MMNKVITYSHPQVFIIYDVCVTPCSSIFLSVIEFSFENQLFFSEIHFSSLRRKNYLKASEEFDLSFSNF